MKIIRSQQQMEPYSSRLFQRYFQDLKVGVFDIETMGLNPASAEVILVGFVSVDKGGQATVTQIFAESKEEERNLLEAMGEEMKKYDVLLTFNGKHFDLPFVMRRCQHHGLPSYGKDLFNLDLYLVLHGHSNLKSIIKSLKQKNVEQYMGLHVDRKDEISGAESITLYENYLAEQNPYTKTNLEERILLHNYDDILQLYRLLPVLKQTDFHRACSYLGFPIPKANGWPQLNIMKIRVDYTGLSIAGTYGGPGISYLSYDDGSSPYSCSFTPEGEFRFLIPADRHKGNYFLKISRLLEGETNLASYPGYINGYLLLAEGNRTNFLEMNMFVQQFLTEFINANGCPI